MILFLKALLQSFSPLKTRPRKLTFIYLDFYVQHPHLKIKSTANAYITVPILHFLFFYNPSYLNVQYNTNTKEKVSHTSISSQLEKNNLYNCIPTEKTQQINLNKLVFWS